MKNNQYRPVKYFVLTFIVTFAFWGIGAYASFSERLNDFYMLFMLAGLLSPFVISLFMLGSTGSKAPGKDFASRLFNLKLIRPGTLPVLFLLMPAVVILSALLSLPAGESPEQFHLAEGFSFSTGAVPVLTLLLLAAAFEELGWRGYAFDSLASRFNYLTASLVFGLLWSAWHLPLLFVNNSYQYEILQQSPWFALNFYVGIIPLGVIISWFCVKNRGSVTAAILFHFFINMAQELLNISQVTKSIETGVLILVATALVLTDKEVFGIRVRQFQGAPA